MSAGPYIQSLMVDHDIICVQEHHLFSEFKTFLTTLSTNYTGVVTVCDENHEFSAIRLRKGGIATLWSKAIDSCVSVLELPIQSDRISVVRVDIPNEDTICLVNVYMPTTNTSIEFYRDSISDLQIIVDWLMSVGVVIICGDLNAGLSTKFGNRANPVANARGIILEEFLYYNNMYSTVSDNRCNGPKCTYHPMDVNYLSSQIDHFITNNDNQPNVVRCYVHVEHSLNMSDHYPISIMWKSNLEAANNYIIQHRFNWNKCDKSTYAQHLRDALDILDNYKMRSPNDIESYVKALQDAIMSTVNMCVPTSRYRPHVRPYWDNELKSLHSEQLRLRHIWISENRPRGNQYPSYLYYKVAKRTFARALKVKQEEHYQKVYEELEKAIDLDVKHLWKNFNSKRAGNSFSTLIVDDEIVNSPQEQCRVWERYYSDLLNERPAEAARYDNDHSQKLRNDVQHLAQSYNYIHDPTRTLECNFTVSEVANVCLSLANNKAAGYDSITNECLKYGGHKLYVVLSDLYNNVIRTCHIPSMFKHSIIIPIYKGKRKSKTAMNSYRGVSLTPVLNKVLEKLIMNRLKPWLTQQNFPPPLQQAGRTGTNCVSLAYAVLEAITNMCDQGSKVYGCFLDIQSAYDVINWDGLLFKMSLLGITDKLWQLFKVWLQGSTSQVRLQGYYSNIFKISRSIKQGGLLSTFFFVLFYHDIHNSVIQGSTQSLTLHGLDMGSPIMADDTLLLSATVNGLQAMINNACKYGRKWRLEYSASKTKCITFGDSKSNRKHIQNKSTRQWYLGDRPLEEVDHYTYLGIILSADGRSRHRTEFMSKMFENIC